MIIGNKSLPAVISLTTALLFLTNLIKNYSPVFFGICFTEQVQNKLRQEKMHHLEQIFIATDLAKQDTWE